MILDPSVISSKVGCRQVQDWCEAVLALRPSGKYLSTELRILLASWRVALKQFVASTMRTCLLTTLRLVFRLRLGGGISSSSNARLVHSSELQLSLALGLG